MSKRQFLPKQGPQDRSHLGHGRPIVDGSLTGIWAAAFDGDALIKHQPAADKALIPDNMARESANARVSCGRHLASGQWCGSPPDDPRPNSAPQTSPGRPFS